MHSLRLLSLLLLCSFSFGITFASFSAEDFLVQFHTQEAGLSSSEKIAYYKKVISNLTLLAIRYRDDKEQSALYTSLKAYVSSQLQDQGSSSSATISFTLLPSATGMTIPNVDLVRVRDVRLALHNAERSGKSLAPFSYAMPLEGTASARAQYLANIGRTTHKRASTDGYYSYASIKERFIDQGIQFASLEKDGQPLFTENIGWNLYSCKKTDCTDDFIKAIKKSRSFFMSEKGKSYSPHYNAIVGNFTQIGLGVGLIGNKYYLVTHYSQDLK